MPYALHAKTAESFSEAINETDPAFTAWDKDYNDLANRPDLNGFATKDMANQNITNLADPLNAQDAATKAYVDALLERLEKLETVRLLRAGGFFDVRDSNYYKVVKIGSQIWMAENLKYLPEVNGSDKFSGTISYYYVQDYHGTSVTEAKATESYNTYGVLYNWPAAMNGTLEHSTSNPSGVQGVCPAGWHLPSLDEWKQMIDFLGGEEVAAQKLMETGTAHWQDPNTGATNESGFTALPGGALIESWGIGFLYETAHWWTSTSPFNRNEQGQYIPEYYPSIRFDFKFTFDNLYDSSIHTGNGFSIRCLKD